MRRQLALLPVATIFFATCAAADDRAVTDDERAKLAAAITAEGCSGGDMEFDTDDNHFEVDDAICGEGQEHDLKFDVSYKLIKKSLDD